MAPKLYTPAGVKRGVWRMCVCAGGYVNGVVMWWGVCCMVWVAEWEVEGREMFLGAGGERERVGCRNRREHTRRRGGVNTRRCEYEEVWIREEW